MEHQLAEAQAGRFRIERLLFHLAGIPTYIVAAELALNRVLRGTLPRPGYPPALRATAPPDWPTPAPSWITLAPRTPSGHLADTGGAIATAACQAAHAVLAERGQCVTNEKALSDRAGLRGVDVILTGLTSDSARLAAAVDQAQTLISTSSPYARASGCPAGNCGAGRSVSRLPCRRD